MTVVRLLMALSLTCSVSAIAQIENDSVTPATLNPPAFRVDRLSDPFLLRGNSTQSPKLMLERFPQTQKNGEITLKPNDPEIVVNLNPDGRMVVPGSQSDSLCYAIRSYVVARDSKHSDSVHPVGYTTCVPARRYQLRTTVEQQGSERDLHLVQR